MKTPEELKELDLTKAATKELVNELCQREGVKKTTTGPYKSVKIEVDGPAVVLTVVD